MKMRWLINSVTLGVSVLLFVLLSLVKPASASTVVPASPWLYGSTLTPFILQAGQTKTVGAFHLIMQYDGNLVLTYGGRVLWAAYPASRKCTAATCLAAFQTDGNLVLYQSGKPYWTSYTGGQPGNLLVLSAAAPFISVVNAGSVRWTGQAAFAPFVLVSGNTIRSGNLLLAMQVDGNFVLYRGSGAVLWAANPAPQNCSAVNCQAVLQGDGNLVLYRSGVPYWASNTTGATSLRVSEIWPYASLLNATGGVVWEGQPMAANSGAAGPTVSKWQSIACPAGTYDMLSWMAPASGQWANHLVGEGSMYTAVNFEGGNRGTLYVVKDPKGFPWDLNFFDENGVYLWLTGMDWVDVTNISFYLPNSPHSTPVKMFPRCARGGFPGTVTPIPAFASGYVQNTFGGGNCGLGMPQKNLGFSNEVWGPYNLSLGGNLPPNTPTLVFAYRYNCNADFTMCGQKEEQYYQQGFGWVMWRLYNWNGFQYVLQNQTTFTNLQPGGMPKFNFPCRF